MGHPVAATDVFRCANARKLGQPDIFLRVPRSHRGEGVIGEPVVSCAFDRVIGAHQCVGVHQLGKILIGKLLDGTGGWGLFGASG